MSRILMRIFALYSFCCYLVLSFIDFSKDFFNESIIGLICLVFFLISLFSLWFFMFYHWGINNFKSIWFKRLWFGVLLLGLFVGGWIYYIVVYEIKWTLVKNETRNVKK